MTVLSLGKVVADNMGHIAGYPRCAVRISERCEVQV